MCYIQINSIRLRFVRYSSNKFNSFKKPMGQVGLLRWLTQEPNSPKHTRWAHPLTVCFIHYSVVIPATIWVNDVVFDDNRQQEIKSKTWLAHGVLTYCFIMFFLRIHPQTNPGSPTLLKAAVYEFTWLCNSCLILGPIGIITKRPLLIMGPAIAVSIDQILWYVDWIGWFFRYVSFLILSAISLAYNNLSPLCSSVDFKSFPSV